jgi:hypothetical protein
MSIRVETAAVSTANVNRDGSGTIAEILSGSSHGTRIDYITVYAINDTTTGMIRLFVYDSSAWRLIKEVAVPATTAAATEINWNAVVKMPALYIGHNQKLGVSTHKAESFHVAAMGWNI